MCHVVRVRRGKGTVVLANLHGTGSTDKRIPDAELLRAAVFADGVAEPDEPVVLAGDFNIGATFSRTLADLTSEEWGFDGPTPSGIDHVLVRGLRAGPPMRWERERRVLHGRLLSDHAPVDRQRRMTFEEARAQFPALERFAYLNAGSLGPLSRATLDAMEERMRFDQERGRGGKAWYDSLLELREGVRQRLAAVIGTVPSGVALTSSTTDGCNIVLSGLGLSAGDEVVTTDSEHSGPPAARCTSPGRPCGSPRSRHGRSRTHWTRSCPTSRRARACSRSHTCSGRPAR